MNWISLLLCVFPCVFAWPVHIWSGHFDMFKTLVIMYNHNVTLGASITMSGVHRMDYKITCISHDGINYQYTDYTQDLDYVYWGSFDYSYCLFSISFWNYVDFHHVDIRVNKDGPLVLWNNKLVTLVDANIYHTNNNYSNIEGTAAEHMRAYAKMITVQEWIIFSLGSIVYGIVGALIMRLVWSWVYRKWFSKRFNMRGRTAQQNLLNATGQLTMSSIREEDEELVTFQS